MTAPKPGINSSICFVLQVNKGNMAPSSLSFAKAKAVIQSHVFKKGTGAHDKGR